ncbi:MarR family winged helix-turn-helix transcriptional regulator [Streptomyces caatingaensis]|uniref:MarR family transcriptional regulator n=1 Tax=Streptomyces caatingaensis TaxID=1678637 RepID=A0A0K9XGC7_9ACTN|nr:MarR family transcriptional regulator [Streptomyces caatingaensis]KNB52435.1 MarR family transcriptional regulator [Streptomyces caatingaensis]
MTAHEQFRELAQQLGAIGVIKRGLARVLPPDCPPTSVIVLELLKRYGEMRMSKLAELLVVDMSVTSRHVAYAAERGWLERRPDHLDKRSRLLSLTPGGAALLDEVSARYTEALAHCLGDWSDEDVAHAIGLLARLRESFGECRPHLSHRELATRTAIHP